MQHQALLAEQGVARGRAACPLLHQVADLWRMLDSQARLRAANCPYMLLDAGFADPPRWRVSLPGQVGDSAALAYAAFFTVPAAGEVARHRAILRGLGGFERAPNEVLRG